MKTPDDSRDDETRFEIGLDHETVRRLMEVADLSHAEPRVILASIIHDVLHDDELAHGPLVPDSRHDRTLN